MVSIWEPTAAMRETWRWIEASGADALWVGDHLWSAGSAAQWQRPRFDTWATLGAIAIETSRVRVGTLVTSVAYRNPAVIAKAAITLDHLSDGRFELGIGAGANPRDTAAAGLPRMTTREREATFGEAVGAVGQFLRAEVVKSDGAQYRFRDVPVAPRPVQDRLPLIVAAGTDASLRVAATNADGWVSFGARASPGTSPTSSPDPSDVLSNGVALARERVGRLDVFARAVGRDPAEIRRLYLMVGPEEPDWVPTEALIEALGRYRDVGIDEFAFPCPSDKVARQQAEAILKAARAQLTPRP